MVFPYEMQQDGQEERGLVGEQLVLEQTLEASRGHYFLLIVGDIEQISKATFLLEDLLVSDPELKMLLVNRSTLAGCGEHETQSVVGRDELALSIKNASLLDDLTVREREVLRLLARGLRNAEIAQQLIISRLTVSTHVRSIYTKLGVKSRCAAARYALEHKLT